MPCDDYIGTTKYCLSIFKEYIRQMKELGAYDNSVIIIASDHGAHDGFYEGFPYPSASTPMMIIKSRNEKHDTMFISDKPFYYMDIQATVLDYAGLYNSNDEKIFGKPIDQISNEPRTRVWIDVDDKNTTYYKYTYKGNTSELERVVKENIYEEVYSFAFDYNEIKQEE